MSNDSSIDRTVAFLRLQTAKRGLGELMPSSRAISAELGVGPVTVQRAVAVLVAEGVLTTRPGVGTFIARPMHKPVSDTAWQYVALGASPVNAEGLEVQQRVRNRPDVLQLAMGYPDGSLRPDGRIAAAIARAARKPHAWEPPPYEGLPELRAWFGSQLGVDPSEVVISSGSQGAISAVMRTLLPSGSPVLFSTPTYPGALAAARSAGLVPVPVPCDDQGVVPLLLERAFGTTGARLAYLQPTFSNPDGQCLAADRRSEVLAIAADAGAFLIEDDWARWLAHGPVAPPPLIRDDAHGHVISLQSLTKAAAPSLRIGAIAARGPVLKRIASMRLVDEFFVSRPLQEASVELVTSAGWQAHLRSLGPTLRQRADTLARSLVQRLPECPFVPPKGGNSLWVRLPLGVDDMDLAERALTEGVAVSPGTIYSIGEQEHRHVRLSFLSIDASLVDEAVRRLSVAMSKASEGRPASS